jgi:hypothetical protein
MKSYSKCPKHVTDIVESLIEKFHPQLAHVKLAIDLLFVVSDAAYPVMAGGYPAYAVVRSVSVKDRVKGCGDAEIVIDKEKYEEMDDKERAALLDHELYHIEPKRDKFGGFERDGHGRPRINMKKHDHNFGWFAEIARRHGMNSIEVKQAMVLRREYSQAYFDYNLKTPVIG